jgi:hypothetical protein
MATTENTETKATETKDSDQKIVDNWLKGEPLPKGVSVRLVTIGGESVWIVERKGS